jgi:hypothetical protein
MSSWRLRYTPTKMVRRALTRLSRVRPLFEKISGLIDMNSVSVVSKAFQVLSGSYLVMYLP